MVCNCELHHRWSILWRKRFNTSKNKTTPAPPKQNQKLFNFPTLKQYLWIIFCLIHFIEPLPKPNTHVLVWLRALFLFFSPVFSPPSRRTTKPFFTLICNKSQEQSKCLTPLSAPKMLSILVCRSLKSRQGMQMKASYTISFYLRMLRKSKEGFKRKTAQALFLPV